MVDWNSGVTIEIRYRHTTVSSKELPTPLGSEVPNRHSEMTAEASRVNCRIPPATFPNPLVSLGETIPPGNEKPNFDNSPARGIYMMVRKGGLEPPHLSVPDPKSGASANSATFAFTTT